MVPAHASFTSAVHCTHRPLTASHAGVPAETAAQSIASQPPQTAPGPQYGAAGSSHASLTIPSDGSHSGPTGPVLLDESPDVPLTVPGSVVPSSLVVVTGFVVVEVVSTPPSTQVCAAHTSPGSQLSSAPQVQFAVPGVQPSVSLPPLLSLAVPGPVG